MRDVSDEHGLSKPVLPLYLSGAEASVLGAAVGALLASDAAILAEEEEQPVTWGSYRAARRDAARDRRPVLMSLQTALAEHVIAAGRQEHGTGAVEPKKPPF
jgi:hypothetical protein